MGSQQEQQQQPFPTLKHLTSKDYRNVPKQFNRKLQEFGRPHVESFNAMLHEGLQNAISSIPPVEFKAAGSKISVKIMDAKVSAPCVPIGTADVSTLYVYPSECRQRKTTYRGKLRVTLSWSKDGVQKYVSEKIAGEIPIMLKSDCCNLANMTPDQLIKHGEDANEFGGYFIINGQEKLFRMLTLPRRNFPIAITRSGWKDRGAYFSEYGITVRCVRDSHTATNMVLHYLTDGSAKLMFLHNKEMFFVPVVLMMKALHDVTDRDISKHLTHGNEEDSFTRGCVANMLRQLQNEKLYNRAQVLNYVGEKFRPKLYLPEWYSNEEVCKFLLREAICIHLNKDEDKFNFLVFMTKKLFAVANKQKALESVDNPMHQEILVGGQLYLMMLKEKLANWLNAVRFLVSKYEKNLKTAKGFEESDMVFTTSKMVDITKPMEHTLATGNLASKSGLGMQELSGLAIVLDKINFLRFASNFQSVHRGSYFLQMRTTAVRKLLPEAWGFVCPVHTPDGTPCGLLNHLTATCRVTTFQPVTRHLKKLLSSLGMTPAEAFNLESHGSSYTVVLDGQVMGFVPCDQGLNFCERLRHLKATKKEQVPPFLEIAMLPVSKYAAQFPGIFLFTTPARMMRPVKNLRSGTTEYVGTFEQVYLSVAVTPEEVYPDVTTHIELQKTNMLSTLAMMTPFSDFNQSPRNMYQCQMCKQSMGTPSHAHAKKPETKVYRLQTPNSPLVKPAAYDEYDLTDYPMGLNAIVAVVSYTGYDMEDAMTINKASLERGFAHGTVYKSEFVELSSTVKGEVDSFFGVKPEDHHMYPSLDSDGFPFIGSYLEQGKPFYSYIDRTTGDMKVQAYKSMESAYVEDVRLLGNDSGTQTCQKACITLRISRNPIIGDKFASRHGQKGICSQKWPTQDMPFTESGMVPDIIFNPHGFPSRMTIGMMIESMAGKSAAAHGIVHDATPFTFSEDEPAADYFGELLKRAGYNYYGTERMYSGVDGREMEADIFFGLVYYQRLRHMVADKYQVRTTGPIDSITHQPIKGRKRAGGIRFGEMERDSLLSHGAAFLLQDRLFNCSDRSLEYICTACGNILSPVLFIPEKDLGKRKCRSFLCKLCGRQDTVELIAIPYVLKYLVCELAAININLKIHVK